MLLICKEGAYIYFVLATIVGMSNDYDNYTNNTNTRDT